MPLIGHSAQVSFFEKVRHSGTLRHAYLFIGPRGVGKRTAAFDISAQLLGVDPERVLRSPDVVFIAQEKNEKTGKTKKHIDIGQIRALRQRLAATSFGGGYRIAIIDRAEKMSQSAANGLLKTLEEPGQKTMLFLISDDESLVPRTIRSRCQHIYFGLVESAQIVRGLTERGVDQDHAADLAQCAAGRPGYALAWAEDPDAFAAYREAVTRFDALFGLAFSDKVKKIEPLFGDKSDHIAQRHFLVRTLGIWQERLGQQARAGTIRAGAAVRIYDAITYGKQLLTENIHPKLILESVLLAIP